MEDGENSGIIAQATDESGIKVSSQGGRSCQSSSPSSAGVKGNNRGRSCAPQQQQQQQQQLPLGHRHPAAAMAQKQQQQQAAQQHHAALGVGQSQAAHGGGGGWATAPVWEHARNIADSMEGAAGGGPSDYNGGGRGAVDWGEVKGPPAWEWDPVGPVYPGGRRGDIHHHSAASFVSAGQSVEGVSVASPPGTNRGGGPSLSAAGKNEGDLHDSNTPPPDSAARVGNLAATGTPPPAPGGLLSAEQQRRLALGLGGDTGVSVERRKSNVHDYGNGARVNIGGASGAAAAGGGGGGDSLIGLKLGSRSYFEDSGGGSRGAAVQSVFAVCPPGKKQRVQSPGVQAPRCQVEGCKQDLSSSKDYHRRHKVCEHHSKTSKVMAGGFEQRFCQQCSRFHMLTEFDEGKRSCRRRLAGHNERRRKPPAESAAIVSPGSSTVFQNENGSHAANVNGEEGKRGTSGLTEQACFIPMQRTPGSSSTSVDSDDQSGSLGSSFKLNQGKGPWPVLGRAEDSAGLACQSQVACGDRQPFLSATTDSVLMFMQSPKGQIAGAGVQQYTVEGSGSMGPGLTLAFSSGPTSVLAGMDAPTSPSVSGMSDSGRALSLLSSQAWGSRGGASGSVSMAAASTQSDVTLEQLISENSRNSFSPRGPQSHFHSSASGTAEKAFRLQPHSSREIGVSPVSRGESREQHRGILSGLGMVGGFESQSMLAVMQGQSEYHRGIQGSSNSTQRPTIDLMQLPSPPSHGQFAEFSALRPFESALFDSQQML